MRGQITITAWLYSLCLLFCANASLLHAEPSYLSEVREMLETADSVHTAREILKSFSAQASGGDAARELLKHSSLDQIEQLPDFAIQAIFDTSSFRSPSLIKWLPEHKWSEPRWRSIGVRVIDAELTSHLETRQSLSLQLGFSDGLQFGAAIVAGGFLMSIGKRVLQGPAPGAAWVPFVFSALAFASPIRIAQMKWLDYKSRRDEAAIRKFLEAHPHMKPLAALPHGEDRPDLWHPKISERRWSERDEARRQYNLLLEEPATADIIAQRIVLRLFGMQNTDEDARPAVKEELGRHSKIAWDDPALWSLAEQMFEPVRLDWIKAAQPELADSPGGSSDPFWQRAFHSADLLDSLSALMTTEQTLHHPPSTDDRFKAARWGLSLASFLGGLPLVGSLAQALPWTRHLAPLVVRRRIRTLEERFSGALRDMNGDFTPYVRFQLGRAFLTSPAARRVIDADPNASALCDEALTGARRSGR